MKALIEEIERQHRVRLGSPQLVGGGNISQSYRCGDYFLKINDRDFAANFEAEAFNLEAIAATKTVRVPCVVATDRFQSHSYLLLEYLPLRPLTSKAERELGTQLASLHQVEQSLPGFERDNFIGATPQPNGSRPNWVTFWKEQRLGHLFTLAAQSDIEFEGRRELLARLPELLPHSPRYSLLHGDLWGGNAACLDDETPVIYDPACYYGDSLVDIAMSQLFGGFSSDFYRSYSQSQPLDADRDEERLELYHLYHLLNHAILFGSSYARQAQQIITKLLR
ncbi:MAG: fructosamine kinase family protein [Verrucomicrobiota bacterium JB023]|nr:fructosamine kinase family protein [Verrucomicrobiota bacterium JB023]